MPYQVEPIRTWFLSVLNEWNDYDDDHDKDKEKISASGRLHS